MQFAFKDHSRPAIRRSEPPRPTPGRFLLAVIAITLSLPHTGCSLTNSVRNYIAYNDTQNDFVMGFRNGVWSRQAWAERRHQFEGQPQLGAFGAGFRAGYVSVASGGNGCPPPVPPRNYWTWKYQTPEGQAKVAAWFSGFPHGAQAAEEDQAGEYQAIQVSYPIEHQYSPGFATSDFIEQNGLDQQLEALPNPNFTPTPAIPLNDSAMRPPSPLPPMQPAGPLPTFNANPIRETQPGPSIYAPVDYQQPIETFPQPPQLPHWPQ